MGKFVLDIPDEDRAIDALCKFGGYADDSDHPRARHEFAKRQIALWVQQTVLDVERRDAVAAALAAVRVDPIDIT